MSARDLSSRLLKVGDRDEGESIVVRQKRENRYMYTRIRKKKKYRTGKGNES